MRSKVVAAEMATAAGHRHRDLQRARSRVRSPRCWTASASARAFPPREARYSSFKLWLKYAKPSRGTVIVDDGAARALREGSASLLPVGVTEVRGEFDAGDAVEIVERDTADGGRVRPLAKGICNYSAVELREVLGLKSEAVREVLPRATDEAVHRDYLVLD